MVISAVEVGFGVKMHVILVEELSFKAAHVLALVFRRVSTFTALLFAVFLGKSLGLFEVFDNFDLTLVPVLLVFLGIQLLGVLARFIHNTGLKIGVLNFW